MNRLSELDDLLRDLTELCQRGSTGTVVFIPTSGTWGKIGLLQGNIVSLRYQTSSGIAALEHLAGIGKIQYSVRLEEPSARKDRPADIDSAKFFGFFSLPVPRISPPASSAPAPATAPIPRTGSSLPRRKKVLVVDADRISRRAMTRMLRDWDFEVLDVESGFDALGQLTVERPDLMLLDPALPDFKGDKVLDAVKRMVTWPMPVFILWGRDSSIEDYSGRLNDSDEILIKPVDSLALLEKISRSLAKSQESPPPGTETGKPHIPLLKPTGQPVREHPSATPEPKGTKAPDILQAKTPAPSRGASLPATGSQFKIPEPSVIQALLENHLAIYMGPIGPMIAANYREAANGIATDEELLAFVEQVRTEIPDEGHSLEFRRALLEEFW